MGLAEAKGSLGFDLNAKNDHLAWVEVLFTRTLSTLPSSQFCSKVVNQSL